MNTLGMSVRRTMSEDMDVYIKLPKKYDLNIINQKLLILM